MAERLCGYCRLSGHRADKCEVKNEHMTMALSHTPKERKFILDSLPKLGFGLGATFRMRNWYNQSDLVCTITGHDWITNIQFTTFKKVKYSKQVKIIQKESFCRIGESLLNADNQYGTINIRALVVDNGSIGEEELALRYAALVRAKDLNPNDTHGPGIITFVSPSFEPFPYTKEELTRRVLIHPRLGDGAKESRWDDWGYTIGILPT